MKYIYFVVTTLMFVPTLLMYGAVSGSVSRQALVTEASELIKLALTAQKIEAVELVKNLFSGRFFAYQHHSCLNIQFH